MDRRLTLLLLFGCSSPAESAITPHLSILAPLDGSVVEGLVVVSAVAPRLSARGRVRFTFPDGFSIDDSVAPYTARWDSEQVQDGPTEIQVEALDGDLHQRVRLRVDTFNGNSSAVHTFRPGDLPLPITDDDDEGITSALEVSGAGRVARLELSLSIDHPSRSDLQVVLHSPHGSTHVIHDRGGAVARDLLLSNFSVPDLEDQPIDGVWSLSVRDLASGDAGTLRSWSLSIAGRNRSPMAGRWAALLGRQTKVRLSPGHYD